jgi:hypothetical protein
MNRIIVKVGSMFLEKNYTSIGSIMLESDANKAHLFPDVESADKVVSWLNAHELPATILRVVMADVVIEPLQTSIEP